jgi:tetratricopeptide (TPR) repeat protein
MDLNSKEDADSKKKIEVLSKIDELKVVANNHYLMGKYDDAIKIAEEIMDIAEEAKLYSIVREEAEHIANLYKQAKDDHKFIVVRDDFEGLKEEYEKLIAQNEVNNAHELL